MVADDDGEAIGMIRMVLLPAGWIRGKRGRPSIYSVGLSGVPDPNERAGRPLQHRPRGHRTVSDCRGGSGAAYRREVGGRETMRDFAR